MKRMLRAARRQRGAALILFATVLVVGVAWYSIGALGRVPVTTAEREVKTGVALQEAKQALLAYVAQYAARSNTTEPGQMPCPESLPVTNEGESSTSCSATAIVIGRLPWKTLGVDPIRDGYGEPLWYMMRGFRNPPINFASTGQLTYAGNTVVAMIIAPGAALHTASTSGTPPTGCTKQNQGTRGTTPLTVADFIECGATSGSIAIPDSTTWTNDRVIAITAAEWADAISGAIADRLQRQVAPAMYDFYNTTSNTIWGQRFFPNSSIFNSPTGTDLCGDNDQREGRPPVASVASGSCDTDWDNWTVSGLGMLLTFGGCTAFTSWVRCDFTQAAGGLITPRINISAPRIGHSFRTVDTSQITIQTAGIPATAPYPAATVGGFASWVSTGSDGRGTFSFQVTLPAVAVLTSVRIRIPYPSDALLADSRSAWYVNNEWGRHTYYGVARAATSDPGTATCDPTNSSPYGNSCLTVHGMPAPNNDKRLVLVLTGRALSGQTWGTMNSTDYLEGLATLSTAASNASIVDDVATATVFEQREYTSSAVTSTFNDRVAACPYKYYAADGTTVLGTACN